MEPTEEKVRETSRQRNALHAILHSWHQEPAMRVGMLFSCIGEIMAFETEAKPGHSDASVINDMCSKMLEQISFLRDKVKEAKTTVDKIVTSHLERVTKPKDKPSVN